MKHGPDIFFIFWHTKYQKQLLDYFSQFLQYLSLIDILFLHNYINL